MPFSLPNKQHEQHKIMANAKSHKQHHCKERQRHCCRGKARRELPHPNFGMSANWRKILFLSEHFHPKVLNSGPKKPSLGKFVGKIVILSTHNLLCRKFAVVWWKIAISCHAYFFYPGHRWGNIMQLTLTAISSKGVLWICTKCCNFLLYNAFYNLWEMLDQSLQTSGPPNQLHLSKTKSKVRLYYSAL